jgi:hypothetical protein
MPGTPFVGLGTVVAFSPTVSPLEYETLVGVTSVSLTGDKVTTDKTTNMLTVDGVDTYIAGTIEPGTCDIKAIYEPGDSSLIALEAARDARTAIPFEITYPLSLGVDTFLGIVETISTTIPLDKPATLDVKVKVTGPITRSEG